MANIVISVEGMDGSGKSFLIRKLQEHFGDRILLDNKELIVRRISPLEDTQVGIDHKKFLLTQGNDHNSLSELRTTFGVHRALLEEVILKSRNTLFLQDRSLMSACVYQVLNKPVSHHSLLKEQMNMCLKEYDDILGDTKMLFVCLRIDAESALANIKKRGAIDTIEKDLPTLKKIEGFYSGIMDYWHTDLFPYPCHVIDASISFSQKITEVEEALRTH